jgi:hypothetical protein
VDSLLKRGSALLRESLHLGGTCRLGLSAVPITIVIAGVLAIDSPTAYGQGYSYTGSEQIYIVPAGTTQLHVVAVGAPGGKGSFPQGSMGAVVSADLPVPQGQGTLYVEVGGTGDGFNGGGASNGGDASDVQLVPSAQPGSVGSRVIVAGGGGGAGQFPGGNAGADGGGGSSGGKAGTSTAGGAGGLGQPPEECGNGSPGSLATGGDGAGGFFGGEAFGGGGGGYYGGGGGGSIGGCDFPSYYQSPLGGGGGGSSYVSPQATNVTFGLDPTRTSGVTITPITPVLPPVAPARVTLSGLRVHPRTFALGGRLVGGRCVPRSKANAKAHPCRRPIALRIAYKLSAPATVTFTLERVLTGRLVGGSCVAPAHANRRARACNRVTTLSGRIMQAGAAGANSMVFQGSVGRSRLGPGSYRLLAAVSGNQSGGSTQAAPFRLLP